MVAIILSVGDELVLGQTVDTNSAWLSQQLAAVGCDIAAHATVGDDQRAVEHAIAESAGRCDVLIVSGGLGPTEDDLTRQAIAAVMKVDLILSEEWLATMQGFFDKIGRTMPESNKIQAMIPRGSKMIFNTCGTAAGIEATISGGVSGQRTGAGKSTTPNADHSPLTPGPSAGCVLFAVPGVPKEMKAMFARDVLPHIEKLAGGAAIRSRTLHTFGLGESTVAERLGELMKRGRNPSVGTTVSGGVVSLRVNARFESVERSTRELQNTVDACHAALGDVIYGQDEDTLPSVVGRLLIKKGSSVATAESCTGGLLAKYLTDAAGSSAYFTHGWITYADRAKGQLLGVQNVEQNGAVSAETVRQMSQSAMKESGSTYALAISGIAGPTGATPEKPVGTVYIALAAAEGWQSVEARHFLFPGDREMVRDRSAKMAMTMLRYRLLGTPLPF